MDNKKIIDEYINILLGLFENYKRKPRWDILQAMFRTILLLGYELGKRDVYINLSMKGTKDYE